MMIYLSSVHSCFHCCVTCWWFCEEKYSSLYYNNIWNKFLDCLVLMWLWLFEGLTQSSTGRDFSSSSVVLQVVRWVARFVDVSWCYRQRRDSAADQPQQQKLLSIVVVIVVGHLNGCGIYQDYSGITRSFVRRSLTQVDWSKNGRLPEREQIPLNWPHETV